MKNIFLTLISAALFFVSGCASLNHDDLGDAVLLSNYSKGVKVEGKPLGSIDFRTLMYTKSDIDILIAGSSAEKEKKKVAMFIIPVNNEAIWTTFKGFELKATTNNFSHATTEFVRLQYYGQSHIASTGLDNGQDSIDKMRLFVCTTKMTEEWRSYHSIANTSSDWTEPLTAVVVLVDTECLLRHPQDPNHPEDDWLVDTNEELIWVYCRIRTNNPPFENENGTENPLWRPITPVRWFSKLPDWAGDW